MERQLASAGSIAPALTPGAREELDYWEAVLARRDEGTIAQRIDPTRRREVFPAFFLPSAPILGALRAFFGLEGPARCVELGSGPLSTLAFGVDAGLLEVTAVDVLADSYAELLARHGIDYPIRPIAVTGERLRDVLPDASFHLAYASNSLDHTDDLPAVFDNLVRLVMPGGALVLQHHLAEGTRQGWSQSHPWDLDHGAGGLRATDRQGKSHELGLRDDLELVSVFYRSHLLDGWIDVIYRRRP